MTGTVVALEPAPIVEDAATILPRVERPARIRNLVILTGASWLLWLLALPFVHPTHMSNLGLISVLGPIYFVALATLTVAFGWTVTFYFKSTRLLVAQVG